MRIKTNELKGEPLDWAVATALGWSPTDPTEYGLPSHADTIWVTGDRVIPTVQRFRPSSDWNQGGPLIKKHLITIGPEAVESGPATDLYWFAVRAIWGVLASSEKQWGPRFYSKESPLIAAMRAIVASELGDEVDVPEELL